MAKHTGLSVVFCGTALLFGFRRGIIHPSLRHKVRDNVQKQIRKIARQLLLLAGAAITVNGLALLFTANLNTGIILTILLGAALLLYGIYFRSINNSCPKRIKAATIVITIIALCFCAFLHINGTTDTITYDEDVIIVLGASVNNKTPGKSLAGRLDAAAEYYKKNADVRIVVSGGRGPQEAITEAQAMETYLVSKGVPKDSIIKEEASTSTYENFQNTKAILDKCFQRSYSVAFVTNEYHIYRAGRFAEFVGIDSATHIHSATPWYLLLPSTLRECLAVVKLWVFKR